MNPEKASAWVDEKFTCVIEKFTGIQRGPEGLCENAKIPRACLKRVMSVYGQIGEK